MCTYSTLTECLNIFKQALSVSFIEKIKTVDGEESTPTPRSNAPIIDSLKPGSESSFNLLFSANPVGLSLDQSGEIGALISPFFYQDRQHNFFVEPSLTVTLTETWESYGITPKLPDKPTLELPDYPLDPQWEEPLLVRDLSPLDMVGDPIDQGHPIDQLSRYKMQSGGDIFTSPLTLVQYGASLVGQTGSLSAQLSSSQASGITALGSNGIKYTVVGAAGVNRAVVSDYKSRLNAAKGQSISISRTVAGSIN